MTSSKLIWESEGFWEFFLWIGLSSECLPQ